MMWFVVYLVCCILSAAIIHELGHALAYWWLTGKKITYKITRKGFSLGSEAEFSQLTDEDYIAVIWTGIIMGGLFLGFVTSPFGVIFVPMMALYAYGSKKDILKLLQYYRRNQQ